MAFVAVGGSYRIIKTSDLVNHAGIIFEGFFHEVSREGTYDNPKAVFTATKPVSFTTKEGDKFDVVPGQRYGIAGGTMLANRAGQVEAGVLVQILYEGTTKLTEGKYKGKDSHRYSVLQDASQRYPGNIPTPNANQNHVCETVVEDEDEDDEDMI